MADGDWYYSVRGSQHGPVEFDALLGLAEDGQLRPTDLVWQIGMADWSAAQTVEGLFSVGAADSPPPPPPFVEPGEEQIDFLQRAAAKSRLLRKAGESAASMPHLLLVSALLVRLRAVFTTDFLNRIDQGAKSVGNLAYVAATILYVLYYLILAVKADSIRLFFGALLVILPVAVVVHYTAVMFLDSGRRRLATLPSAMFSQAFLNCFGLMTFVGALVYLILGVYLVIQAHDFASLAAGLGMAAILVYATGAALNPASLEVVVSDEGGAGSEALGVVLFLTKLPLRLVPVLYAVGTVAATSCAGYILYLLFKQGLATVSQPVLAGMDAMDITATALATGLIPVTLYFAFVACQLVLDLVRALLEIPGRLDRLREVDKSTSS